MLLDKQNTFSDQQSLVSTFGTPVVSTNSIDLWGNAGLTVAPTDTCGNTLRSDLGRAHNIDILVQITVLPVSGGSATVSFDVITATDGALTAGVVVHQSTAAIPYANLVPGTQLKLALHPGLPATGRYLGVRFNTLVANITAGNFTAGLVNAKQTNIALG